MQLTEAQKKYLKGLAHSLKPTVVLGSAGLSEGVMNELHVALNHHELIKARARVGDRCARDEIIHTICEQTGASLVQRIGNVAVLYRPNPDKSVITLPR